jgi:hypothetical protein
MVQSTQFHSCILAESFTPDMATYLDEFKTSVFVFRASMDKVLIGRQTTAFGSF